ncbi:MAG: SRPBCC family protein [Gemmatimonadaceae bacterium]
MATQQIPTRRQNGTDGAGRSASSGSGEWKDAPEHYSETPDWKDGTTKFLGWFSVGLGLAELFAPRSVAKLIGIEDEDEYVGTLRSFGVRELAAGFGLLTRPKPTYWLWSRVGGDTIDLAFLARRMRDENENNNSAKLLAATVAVLGVTALDIMQGAKLASEKLPAQGHDEGSFQLSPADDGTVRLAAQITVGASPEDVYAFWQDLGNLPRFMGHLESVQMTENGRSHWKAKAPTGLTAEWDAETIEDRPNEYIAWHSLEHEAVDNLGSVTFIKAPGDRGTEVHLEMEYHPRGGAVGAKLANMFRKIPEAALSADLKRFKQMMELGEITISDPTAVEGMQPAQPPARERLKPELRK